MKNGPLVSVYFLNDPRSGNHRCALSHGQRRDAKSVPGVVRQRRGHSLRLSTLAPQVAQYAVMTGVRSDRPCHRRLLGASHHVRRRLFPLLVVLHFYRLSATMGGGGGGGASSIGRLSSSIFFVILTTVRRLIASRSSQSHPFRRTRTPNRPHCSCSPSFKHSLSM